MATEGDLAKPRPGTGCHVGGGRVFARGAARDACVHCGFAVAESFDLSGSGFSVWLSARILLPCRDEMVEQSVARAQLALDVGIERRGRNIRQFHRHLDLDGLEHCDLRIDGCGMLPPGRARHAGEGPLSHRATAAGAGFPGSGARDM